MYDERWETEQRKSVLQRLTESTTVVKILGQLGLKREAKKVYEAVTTVIEGYR
jgi:hypothetical protein